MYNRKPWETTFKQVPRDKNNERDRKAEMLAKTFHVEVAEDDADSLLSALRKWIHDGTANAKFGPFVKLVECLTSQSPRSQVERTVRMNGHGRRFQASVSTIELEGLLNPNGIVGTCNVRDMILNYGMENNKSGDHKSNRIFLSVTRKWNSSAWQATYISQSKEQALEFASCPCAWLRHLLDKVSLHKTLYKHFSPDAATEAGLSEYDEAKKQMITPSEKEAQHDESEIATLSWLVDLSNIESVEESTVVTFQDGRDFDFQGDLSVKTTRVTTEDEGGSKTPGKAPPKSILRRASPTNDSTSVTSDLTTQTRMQELETSICDIQTSVNTQISSMSAKFDALLQRLDPANKSAKSKSKSKSKLSDSSSSSSEGEGN